MESIKYQLTEDRIPRAWYNITPDLPKPLAPVLHPGTHKPVGPDDLAPLFPMAVILQEVSGDREIEIPEPVRQVYAQWRPTPLYRARRLEKALDTPARIYYKYEGVSPAGSHKPNTAVAQAYYNKRSEEHTSELQSHVNLVCRLLLEKKKFVIGFLLPYTLVLDARVRERVGDIAFSHPTRVYSMPVALVAGVAMNPDDLTLELKSAVY